MFCWCHLKILQVSKADNNDDDELRTGKNCHKGQGNLYFEVMSKHRYVENLQNYDCSSGRSLRTFSVFCHIMQLEKTQ